MSSEIKRRVVRESEQRFFGTRRLHLQAMFVAYFTLVPCLASSSNMKMEAIFSSEILADFQRMHGVISQKTEFFK
jgi:hypothetical protein